MREQDFTVIIDRLIGLHRDFIAARAERPERSISLGKVARQFLSTESSFRDADSAIPFTVRCIGEALAVTGSQAMSTALRGFEVIGGDQISSWVSRCWAGIEFPDGGSWVA